jgi:hypothetical protein
MKTLESHEQQGRRLILEGYSDQFVKMANRCTTWLFWHIPVTGTRRKILNSGTVFFVDLGSGPFGVTAAHVIEGLRQDKKSFSDLECQIGNLRIDPSDQILGLDSSRDLATFSIASEDLFSLNLVPHVDPGPWPPRLPQECKGGFFGGFRLGEGKVLDLREPYPFDFWYGFGVLTGVYDQQLKMHFERKYWVHRPNRREPAPGTGWGGVSGGPLFALFENQVVFYQLVGIISQYSEILEVLVMKPARFIAKMGSLSI